MSRIVYCVGLMSVHNPYRYTTTKLSRSLSETASKLYYYNKSFACLLTCIVSYNLPDELPDEILDVIMEQHNATHKDSHDKKQLEDDLDFTTNSKAVDILKIRRCLMYKRYNHDEHVYPESDMKIGDRLGTIRMISGEVNTYTEEELKLISKEDYYDSDTDDIGYGWDHKEYCQDCGFIL